MSIADAAAGAALTRFTPVLRRTRRLLAATLLVGLAVACGDDAGVRTGDAGAARPAATAPGTTSTSAATTTTAGETHTTGTDTTVDTTVDTTSDTSSNTPTPGDGLGDEPFPELGNPGIDVTHYDVDLSWDPAASRLTGHVGVALTLTENRPVFTLDATDALDISAVTLDGTPVEWSHDAPELRVTPSGSLAQGSKHTVVIDYTTEPGDFTGAGGASAGWLVSDRGTYTLNEPDLARSWLPCDDHPSDKATWQFSIAVPDGMTAVANGRLVRFDDTTKSDTWVWAMDEPMSTYLVQVLTGDYELVTVDSPPGTPDLSSAVLRGDRPAVQSSLDGILPMISWFSGYFGPYPFDSYGLAVPDSVPGLAMEQQTRSLFPRSLFTVADPDREMFLSHELAHQWFGDAVSPASWQDVWLNESFATYAEWMWIDHLGQRTLDESATRALRESRVSSPAEPGRNLFGYEVYDGGAVVLHALRRTLGDDAFFRLLRSWVTDNEGTSRTTADFIAEAERVAGRSLSDFFDTWLYTTKPPAKFP